MQQQPAQKSVQTVPLIQNEVQITPTTPAFEQALKQEQERQASEAKKKEEVNNG